MIVISTMVVDNKLKRQRLLADQCEIPVEHNKHHPQEMGREERAIPSGGNLRLGRGTGMQDSNSENHREIANKMGMTELWREGVRGVVVEVVVAPV